MKKEAEKPDYCNLSWWILRFEEHRDEEFRFLNEWLDEARALVVSKAKTREWGRNNWWTRTELLVAWSDYHPEVKVDPAPFQMLMGGLWKKFHGGKGAPCREAIEMAMHPWQRLQLANAVWRSRFAETLGETELPIKDYIDKHPGASLKKIAAALTVEENTVAKRLEKKRRLYKLGYKQPKHGSGYYPPDHRM